MFRDLVPEGAESVGDRRLFPMVARRFAGAGLPLPEALRRAYAESFAASTRLMDETAGCLNGLAAAGIPAMVLKGAALLLCHYRDIGARPMSDVDLLVPASRIEAALDVLEGLGWRGDPSRGWLKTGAHAGTLSLAGGMTLDLHRYATCEARFSAANDAFFADAVPIRVAGAPALAMSAEDQLLHSVVHGLRWSIARSTVWILDALTLLRTDQLNVERVARRAEDLRLRVALADGLEVIRQVLDPGPQAGSLARSLRRVPLPWSERIEHHFRVREPAGLLGALPNLWFAHQRSVPRGEVPAIGFAAFLRESWGVRDRPFAPVVAQKIRRRLLPPSPGA